MRKGFSAALIVGAAMLAGAILGQPAVTMASTPDSGARTIQVVGRGVITAQYDTAVVTVGVEATKDSASGAYEAMAAKMDKVTKALVEKYGLTEDQMKTGSFYLYPKYDWTEDRGTVLAGYTASNTLTITTQKLDTVPYLVQAAVEAGANRVDGIKFTIKDTDALLNQALDIAVDDARTKAEHVAARLGVKIVGVQNVMVQDNGDSYVPPVFLTKEAVANDAAVAPVYSGTADYTATVTVSFVIQ